MQNVINTLRKRGFIENTTHEILSENPQSSVKVYVGFDPSADSLHIGNLVAIMGLAWFQRWGYEVIAVVGGATGMIGDPSGKSIERNLLDAPSIKKNVEGISRSLKSVLGDSFSIVNNYDWFSKMTFIDFLRDIGKHFRVGSMLSKESVRNRLNSETGISFTEFSYQLLQAYDFMYLYDHYGVTVQMGGSDQWGNITAGTEFVRKQRGVIVHGITFPLLTRSDGKKFGKTEEGTVWLNSDRLSAYDFYQYFYRIPDMDVIKLLKVFTFIELEEIQEIEASMKTSSYIPNTAQKRLAEEVTRMVHGSSGLSQAQRITQAAKPGMSTELSAAVLESLASQLPTFAYTKSEIYEMSLIDLYVKTGLAQSKSEIRRLIEHKGAYLNNASVTDGLRKVNPCDVIEGRFLLLQVGKKKKIIISVS